MKVLFINNYPMDHAWELWQKGEYPGQHLWGVTHLSQHGIEVEIFPYQVSKLFNKIGRKLGLGDHLDQQLRILFRRRDYDVIYSACQTTTLVLSLLRSLGLFSKPIVALIHHPLTQQTFRDTCFLNGHDRLLCLSSTVMKPFSQQPGVFKKMELVKWGADLSFYDAELSTPDSKPVEASIVSAGKTERDHDTLVKAFLEIDYPLTIYCSATSAPTIAPLPDHIKIYASDSRNNAVPYSTVLAAYRHAPVIAIPLKANNLAGLTSLLDAMAAGKPVVMTRNKLIDLDIEKEGIGMWVEQGDVKDWHRAITYLLSHPTEAQAMGERARSLCEEQYNLESFAASLANTLKTIPI